MTWSRLAQTQQPGRGQLGPGSWRGVGPCKYFVQIVRDAVTQGDVVFKEVEQESCWVGRGAGEQWPW